MRTSAPIKGFRPTLFAAFSLAVMATIATTVVGLLFVQDLRADLIGATTHAHRLAQVHDLRFDLERVVATSRGYLMTGESERRQKAQLSLSDARTSLAELKTPTVAPIRGPLIEDVHRAATAYLDTIDHALQSQWKGMRSATLLQDELTPKRDDLEAALGALVRAEDLYASSQFRESEKSAARIVLLLLGLGGLSVLLSFGAAWFFGRRLIRSYRTEQDAVRAAQQALAARDDLLAIVAHDLRSPLSAIRLRAEFIRMQSERDEPDNRFAKQVASIESTTLRMEILIKSLLEAATIEAGQMSLDPEPCRVEALLSAAFEIFEPLADQKSIRLAVERQPPEEMTVLVDRDRLVQVLSNLLSNAVKFTPERGAITVRVDRLDEEIRMSVSDTGPGIPVDQLPHLFSRYWKAERGGRRGTGLGLYIAKGIVEANGGKIWVDSTPGTGSTFFFTMPTARTLAERVSSRSGRLVDTADLLG